MRCAQPGCEGSILDGYCDVCGLAAVPGSVVSGSVVSGPVVAGSGATGGAASTRSGTASSRLGTVPLGSARTTTGGSRPTRRLGGGAQTSRLGAGLTHVPPIPEVDPRQSLMNPPAVAEEKRYCSVCQAPVGRSREGSPGRSKGFCAKCRTPFDFEPKLAAGDLLGGQYEVVGRLAHGGMGWIYLARDRNVNDRWVVLKGLLNAGDPDASRAAVAEKQYLAEVEHPLIVEIYNFVTSPDGNSYIVMEYVGGRSLNNMLKDRMKANNGLFSAIPVDQAIAYIVEILPAFGYLHSLGLLYCDFKPANLIQVGDSMKLIDLGGVRRIDDDQSPIYGTVGFQAPEVAAEGTTIASDMYTVARTLAVLIFEFKGYQSQYETSLPGADEVPLFHQFDSLYRWLLKGTAARPEDRFQSADEMREQLLGVLREVSAAAGVGAVTRSTPSHLFLAPAAIADQLSWRDLPRLTVDSSDPMAAWLAGVTADQPAARFLALKGAAQQTVAVLAEQADAALRSEQVPTAEGIAHRILEADPWEWRGVWLQGLAALSRGDHVAAVAAFNAVYGQLPGELAPKLALAVACEAGGEPAVAERMYTTCARTDSAYVAAGLFGLARVAARNGQRDDALAALDRIPPTSRAFGDARRARALLLAATIDPDHALADLALAAGELEQATMQPVERADLRIRLMESALQLVRAKGPQTGVHIGTVPAVELPLRRALESAYRDAARLAPDSRQRVALVDKANAVRPRTLV
ncbi:MAG: tetratricopeptide repeat protein [Actinomycetota bacterium]|nr:tetratricopeptide repeat protein [Actinomycetota bacterium]